jgi:hypothetical protein
VTSANVRFRWFVGGAFARCFLLAVAHGLRLASFPIGAGFGGGFAGRYDRAGAIR